jgi:DNA-binding response OmpR family regulator
MDIMIEGSLSGCELAMQIRAYDKNVIIIFVTAYTSEEMIAYALDAKAYSYLLKPYRDVEIISTIQMAIGSVSKMQRHSNDTIECKNGYRLNTKTKKIYHYTREIILNEKLYLLIKLLIKNKGTSISYQQIEESIYDGSININTLRSDIYRLKQKLPELDLHSISKTGYVLY